MKLCVFLIFQICPWIIDVGNWALRWTEGNETVQVIFVMLVFPVIMNAIQYYIIDGFIKNQAPSDHEPIPSEDGEGEDEDHAQQQQEEDWDSSFAGLEETPDPKVHSRNGSKADRIAKSKIDPNKLDEYNPERDGDSSPTAVGSGSNSLGRAEDESLLKNGERS